MAILGTGDISIDNLFYAITTEPENINIPNKYISGRYYNFTIQDNPNSLDTTKKNTIAEVDIFGNTIRQFIPEEGIYSCGRGATWYYDTRTNEAYIFVAVDPAHVKNTTGTKEVWLLKVDLANLDSNLLFYCPDLSVGANDGYVIYELKGNKLYWGKGDEGTWIQWAYYDLDTGNLTTIRHQYYPEGGEFARQPIGKDGDTFLMISSDGHNSTFKIARYNFLTDTYTSNIYDIRNYMNPDWIGGIASVGGLWWGGPVIVGKLMYLPCNQGVGYSIDPSYTRKEPLRFEVLVININDMSLSTRFIGSNLGNNGYARGVLFENMLFFGILDASSKPDYAFFAPQISKANTLFKNSDNKILKQPKVPIQDYPVKFDATKLVTGTSNIYGEVDGSGNLVKLSDYNWAGESSLKVELKSTGSSSIQFQNNGLSMGGTNRIVESDPNLWMWDNTANNASIYIGVRTLVYSGNYILLWGESPSRGSLAIKPIISSPPYMEINMRVANGVSAVGITTTPMTAATLQNVIVVIGVYCKVYIDGIEQDTFNRYGSDPNVLPNFNNPPIRSFSNRLLMTNQYNFQRLTIGRGEPNIQELNDWLTNGD